MSATLARHTLRPGNGYHRTRRCECGWATRDTGPHAAHRQHVAEQILTALEEAGR